jgi:hypothetical protein
MCSPKENALHNFGLPVVWGTPRQVALCGAHLSIWHALLAFTLTAGLVTITPELDTALVLRTAAVEGPRRAMLAGIGICWGCRTWGFATSIGLSALLAVSRLTSLRGSGWSTRILWRIR